MQEVNMLDLMVSCKKAGAKSESDATFFLLFFARRKAQIEREYYEVCANRYSRATAIKFSMLCF